MASPGSRTKTTDVWSLPQDEQLIGQRISDALPRSGWLCSHPGPKGLHQVHLHRHLGEALSCGGRQAFLLLPTGARAPEDVLVDDAVAAGSDIGHSAVMQFLCSRRLQDGEGEVFEAGRLAVRWIEQEVGTERHQLLTEETSLAWKALRAATRPAIVENTQGRRTSGMRIGPAAQDLVTRSGMPLTRGGVQRLHLVAALPTTQMRDKL
ncbi:hypothetical protein [Kitasatospora sp. NRRL B-11411]|uniref:hypothetical protein n=1 Tax=Kitasatospora sp. NRRL B-11411 TaxID=1463822 RepID=UPI00069175C1|nr:hypothetical protein [Kitasatospora sp. NRRL B-11411]